MNIRKRGHVLSTGLGGIPPCTPYSRCPPTKPRPPSDETVYTWYKYNNHYLECPINKCPRRRERRDGRLRLSVVEVHLRRRVRLSTGSPGLDSRPRSRDEPPEVPGMCA